MNISWKTLGPTWRMEGIRHPQSLFIAKVPSVTPAAMIEPIYTESSEYIPLYEA